MKSSIKLFDIRDANARAPCFWQVGRVNIPKTPTLTFIHNFSNHGIQRRNRLAGILVIIFTLSQHFAKLREHFSTRFAAPFAEVVRFNDQQVIFDHVEEVAEKLGARFV
jgi:hypothetical protein